MMFLEEEINKYLHNCKFQKELDDKTVRAYKADLKQFVTLIGENDLDKERLLAHLYKERDIIEYSEWHRKIILRDIAVVETLFSTGLRISELCHLQNKYVDLRNGVLCIQGKGEKERYLQIGNSDVLSILNIYKKCFEEEIKRHRYFFVNR